MAKLELTDSLKEKYKKHPRILEIRIILLFDMLERELGYNGVNNLLRGICYGYNRHKDILDIVLSRRYAITRSSRENKRRWKQEVIFTCLCFGESYYNIGKNYLSVASSNFYRKDEHSLNINAFLTDEWLKKLDDEVFIAGGEMYRKEIISFLEIVEGLADAFSKWKLREEDTEDVSLSEIGI